jgi:outer membrane biogenesis lipoprotein LolB
MMKATTLHDRKPGSALTTIAVASALLAACASAPIQPPMDEPTTSTSW